MKNIFQIQKNITSLVHRLKQVHKEVSLLQLEDYGKTNINIKILYNVARRSLLCRYRNQCFDTKEARSCSEMLFIIW